MATVAVVAGSLMIFEFLVEITHHIFRRVSYEKMRFLQKCYQNLVRNVRHCNQFARILQHLWFLYPWEFMIAG